MTRQNYKNQRFKEMYQDRLKRIKRGQEAPETEKEWAIWHKGVALRNAAKLKMLNNQAAINKPSTMSGKIVVVPPKPA